MLEDLEPSVFSSVALLFGGWEAVSGNYCTWNKTITGYIKHSVASIRLHVNIRKSL
jgi:hypothetical protein